MVRPSGRMGVPAPFGTVKVIPGDCRLVSRSGSYSGSKTSDLRYSRLLFFTPSVPIPFLISLHPCVTRIFAVRLYRT